MIVLGLVFFSLAMLALGAFGYAPLIGRVIGERRDRITPAVAVNDGRDYVPTRTPVVFAHHFASIAGAGPIIGPVLALYYGWLPAVAWILIGGVFLGATHDYVVTHMAMREGGKNITVVARRYVGAGAFLMLLVLLVALLALICAAFLDLSATALTSTVSLTRLELTPEESMFRLEGDMAVIGGIASTSVVVITLFSPFIGYLYIRRQTPVWVCSLLALIICTVSILVGLTLPMQVKPETWKVLISAYVLVAAGVPVWFFLQSRDFINVHILYVGILFVVVAVIAAAIRGGGGEAADAATAIPMLNWSDASAKLGPGWPVLFITIACGAVSGFHSLCAGGTTCKQLTNEIAARRVGYYAMLLESLLAICVVCCLLVGASMSHYLADCYPASGKGNAVLTFAMAVGHTANVGLGLPVSAGALGAMLLLEGFLVTTLDTAVRLTRYMIEEGWATIFRRYDVFADAGEARTVELVTGAKTGTDELAGTGGLTLNAPPVSDMVPRQPVIATRGFTRAGLSLLRHYWVNSGLAVCFMLLLGWGNGYKTLWSIFGSANQLLAALALLIATCWLISRGRSAWFTLPPTAFMMVTSVTMLIRLLAVDYLPKWPGSAPLVIADIIVLSMTAGVMTLAAHRWWTTVRETRAMAAA
ncbi:MAG TPA: carbon starvation CstA family protein [Phycisphaerae bacterium]|nr:carbon starvation CstA family protein [Phycisphaerae bacterium]HRY69714.1 carbon starvation CstA family protein [Phycisphaerae bacterium]HSA25089.1 carbon starvation CstA family protein [Phycisphaerae bacterium]